MAAVQRVAIEPKTTGNRRTADQILDDLLLTSIAVPRDTLTLLVDDNVQTGSNIAALDKLLGACATRLD